jgi:hypothetical protein
MSPREQALVEAMRKAVAAAKERQRLSPESSYPAILRECHFALKAYADCPECCTSPELCAGTGHCPRDPVCNN